MNSSIDFRNIPLEEIAKVVRRDVIDMIYYSGMGHPGSSLSCVEQLVALYFGNVMNVRPNQPDWMERDRFVFSKGHASPTLYSVLARRGFFPVKELRSFRQTNSRLPAYPDMSTPGVDMGSGSLGNGLSAAVGMAVSSKIRKIDNYIYVIMGDGEQQEGMIWEAAMCAAHHNLDHIIAFVDRNKLQITGTVEEVMNINPLDKKWQSFGWDVQTVDGHSFPALLNAIENAKAHKGSPSVILADTVKGKGVSYMENVLIWHRNVISDEQYKQAVREINAREDLV